MDARTAVVTRCAPRGGYVATRLAAIIVGVSAVVVAGYMAISYLQRRELLSEGVAQQVEVLGTALYLPAEDLLRAGRVADLDHLLRAALQANAVYAATVMGADRRPLAGDAMDLSCLLLHLPAKLPGYRAGGAAACGDGVRWLLLPLRSESTWLLVGVEQVLLNESVSAAVRRQLGMLAVLGLALAVAVLVLLRRSPVPQRGPAAEALAANAALLRQTEETLSLERRLAQTERFAMIGRLSGGLAHELGSPLSVIGMRASAIRERTSDARVKEQAGAIALEVGRVSAFIEGLLHLAGKQGIVTEPLDLRTIAERVHQELAVQAEDARVDLRLQLPPEPVIVKGQETMLVHALRNGVRNAVQALAAHDGARQVDIRIESSSAHHASLVVEDSGPGVPAADLEKVFEPFHTTRAATRGMGLGLPITRGIIEEHGGEVRIENRAAGGVRLTLTLPLQEQTT